MINTHQHPDRHNETIAPGDTVAFCRCWQSAKFPYCNGTHRKLNAEGENVGPVIVTAGTSAASDE